jgi:hypothetical protein
MTIKAAAAEKENEKYDDKNGAHVRLLCARQRSPAEEVLWSRRSLTALTKTPQKESNYAFR